MNFLIIQDFKEVTIWTQDFMIWKDKNNKIEKFAGSSWSSQC